MAKKTVRKIENKRINIAVVLGTRPEIIKLSCLVAELKKNPTAKTTIIFTGQHYDYNLCQIFMDELNMPKITVNLGINGGSNAWQVSKMLEKLSEFFSKNKTDIVVAQGDTNSVVAAGLASFYSGIKFAHVEAGLRSFDWRMPEEANRIIADSLSSYAFAPTEQAIKNLKNTSAKQEQKVFLTGNTIVEAVEKNIEKAKTSKILQRMELIPETYAVLTAHRQEYVDKKENLLQLLSAIEKIDAKIIFPMHPRTKKKLEEFGLAEKAKKIKNLHIIEPIGYFDFLKLASNSMFLLSDSGGIQEEASVYKKFVIVLRDKTERPEIIGTFGSLTGYNTEKIIEESKKIIKNHKEIRERLKKIPCPFGDGKASKRIAKILVGEE